MREKKEPGKNLLEIAVAAAALVAVVVCVLSDASQEIVMTPVSRAARERQQNRQCFLELRTRSDALEAALADVQSKLADLAQGQAKLSTKVSATGARAQQLEDTLRQTNTRLAEFGEPGQLQQVMQERDAALTQNQRNDDEIRQLTLKLQRAGVYP